MLCLDKPLSERILMLIVAPTAVEDGEFWFTIKSAQTLLALCLLFMNYVIWVLHHMLLETKREQRDIMQYIL